MASRSSPQKPWPETWPTWGNNLRYLPCSIYNRWSFAYMNPILRKGKGQFKNGDHLVLEDLYEVPDDMKSDVLAASFWRHYRENKRSVVKALFKIAAPAFVAAGFWEFLYAASRVTLPICLRYILIVIEQNPGQNVVSEGLPYAIILSIAACLSALAQNRTTFLSTKSGIILRAALIRAIYKHSLRLSPAGRAGLTTGEVTNLVAVDTQKLYDVMLEFHNLWSCPILIVVVSVLLSVIVGPTLMVGVVVLILMLPLVQTLVSRMLRIRKERSKLTDARINLLTAMLQGIRVTKLNFYEGKVEEHVSGVRDQEMRLLRKELRMWGLVLSVAVVSPLIAFGVAVSFYVLVDEDNILTPSKSFTALLLFSILRFPVNMTARLVGKAAQALEANRRISNFLDRELRSSEPGHQSSQNGLSPGEGVVVDIQNRSFAIKPDFMGLEREASSPCIVHEASNHATVAETVQALPQTFTIRNISLQLRKGQVVAVVGKVGSGKTLLLRALLGEIPSASGTELSLDGRISYAAQLPFILNATVRDNILFGSEFDEGRYEKALDACCLRPDLKRLGEAEDLTEIGERGVTLSGGQKQRVALARSVYADPDITLLDDIFSALDSSTTSQVFDSLFGFGSEKDGILRSSGTILVTHAIQFLPRVDLILIMEGGCPTFCGTWSELQEIQGSKNIADTVRLLSRPEEEERKQHRYDRKKRREGISEHDGNIMTVEEREYGIASLSAWTTWFYHAGGWSFAFMQLVFLVFDRGFYVASDFWVAIWSDAAYESTEVFGVDFPPQTDGRSAQAQYVSVYALIIVLSVVSAVTRSLWAVAGGARCADQMFRAMTKRVLRAPMSYFETTPLGRVLNRFTYDVEVLDIELSVSMTGLMISFSWLVSSVVVMVVVLPYIIIGIIPVTILYYFIQLYYRMSGPDLQRIDAVSRSPIQASLAEGLDGSVTIRAFSKEIRFTTLFGECVDRNSSAMLNYIAAQRWLGLRIELLGASITLALTLTIVCANETLGIPAGMVGLVIQWAVVFSAALNFFFLRLTESEARITSIERIQRATELPQEAEWKTDPSFSLDPSWPSSGVLEFVRVSMRYRKDLPLALNSVSFKLSSGTRCGIVGRTGSGKTSLAAALFRLVEIESGRILLDGVDLSRIGLADVRGRTNGLRVIPQDPVLFAGTLRDCVDPFKVQPDDKILEALQAVNHDGAHERGLAVLGDPVEEGGTNFSVGERQLLCLARAIVEEPRVLVLDEATASVDATTDSFLQTMLRTRFQNTTMLTIAHRLHTIMDYDVVVVMEDGHAVEFGPPQTLLENPHGVFTSFVEATGSESAAELRRKASFQAFPTVIPVGAAK